ncbi:MAG: hypothetical protein ACR2QQ_04090 [Gammaproteobacteria bacterium]
MGNLFNEIKQRQMFKAFFAYLVVAFLFIQIGIATFPVMRVPDWTITALLLVLALLFPVAMYKAWTQGDRAEKDAEGTGSS